VAGEMARPDRRKQGTFRMNTANLQLEGLLLALAALTRALRERGVMTQDELDAVLERAAVTARDDHSRTGQISPSNVEAVLFPIRFLRIANERADSDAVPAFSELASEVGRRRWEPVR
jgi:hypothetical protein